MKVNGFECISGFSSFMNKSLILSRAVSPGKMWSMLIHRSGLQGAFNSPEVTHINFPPVGCVLTPNTGLN